MSDNTFHPFPRLPQELQQKIWVDALPAIRDAQASESRVVSVLPCGYSNDNGLALPVRVRHSDPVNDAAGDKRLVVLGNGWDALQNSKVKPDYVLPEKWAVLNKDSLGADDVYVVIRNLRLVSKNHSIYITNEFRGRVQQMMGGQNAGNTQGADLMVPGHHFLGMDIEPHKDYFFIKDCQRILGERRLYFPRIIVTEDSFVYTLQEFEVHDEILESARFLAKEAVASDRDSVETKMWDYIDEAAEWNGQVYQETGFEKLSLAGNCRYQTHEIAVIIDCAGYEVQSLIDTGSLNADRDFVAAPEDLSSVSSVAERLDQQWDGYLQWAFDMPTLKWVTIRDEARGLESFSTQVEEPTVEEPAKELSAVVEEGG